MYKNNKSEIRHIKFYRKISSYLPSVIYLSAFFIFYLTSSNLLFSESAGFNSKSGAGSISYADKDKKSNKFKKSGGASASKGEYIDYFKKFDQEDTLREYSYIPIKHISESIYFDEGLTVEQYQILIKDMFSSQYPELNIKSAVSKYYFRALAENVYSLDGYLPADKFNSITDARAVYFKINNFIDSLNIRDEIKRSLNELYIFACVYMQEINLSIDTLKKLTKIPPDCIIFELKDYRGKIVFGEYTNDRPGENLYYICTAFYDNFINLPTEKQVKVLDYIYSFNPTLQIAPPIIPKYNFFRWIISILPFHGEQHLLNYCVRGNVNWLLLPKTIETP